jgi:hypothetical protein
MKENYSEARRDAAIMAVATLTEALGVPIKSGTKFADAKVVLDGRVSAIQTISKIAIGLRTDDLVDDQWISDLIESLEQRTLDVQEAFIGTLASPLSPKFADKELKKIAEGKLYAFQKISEVELAMSDIREKLKKPGAEVKEESPVPQRIENFAKKIS